MLTEDDQRLKDRGGCSGIRSIVKYVQIYCRFQQERATPSEHGSTSIKQLHI